MPPLRQVRDNLAQCRAYSKQHFEGAYSDEHRAARLRHEERPRVARGVAEQAHIGSGGTFGAKLGKAVLDKLTEHNPTSLVLEVYSDGMEREAERFTEH